jgi:hypothetical protein
MAHRVAARPEGDAGGRADLLAARTPLTRGAGPKTPADRLLALQHAAGNRAVARLVKTERPLSRAPVRTPRRGKARGLKVRLKADHDMRGDEVGVAVLEQLYGRRRPRALLLRDPPAASAIIGRRPGVKGGS